MKKSELNDLIREVLKEYEDPYAGVKQYPTEKSITPDAEASLSHTLGALKVAYTVLKKRMEAIYGDKFKDIEVYLESNSDGPEIQVHGRSKNPKVAIGGHLDLRYPTEPMPKMSKRVTK